MINFKFCSFVLLAPKVVLDWSQIFKALDCAIDITWVYYIWNSVRNLCFKSFALVKFFNVCFAPILLFRTGFTKFFLLTLALSTFTGREKTFLAKLTFLFIVSWNLAARSIVLRFYRLRSIVRLLLYIGLGHANLVQIL